MHAVTEFIDQQGEFGRRLMDLDYEVYAEGEAELGWLNMSVLVGAEIDDDLELFGLRDRQRDCIDWVPRTSLDESVTPDDVITDEAVGLFDLTVCLRVSNGCKADIDPSFLSELHELS
jgi:hypothetical protein